MARLQLLGGITLAVILAVGVPVGVLFRLAHGELHQVLRQDGGKRADHLGRVHRQHGDDQRPLGGQIAPRDGDPRGRCARADEDRAAHLAVERMSLHRTQLRGDGHRVVPADGKITAQDEAAPPPVTERGDGKGDRRLAGDAVGSQPQIDILGELEADFRLAEAGRCGAGLREAELRGHRQQPVDLHRRGRVAHIGGAHARLEHRAELVTAYGPVSDLAGIALRRIYELPRHGRLPVVQRQSGTERGARHGALELACERQDPVGREGCLRQAFEGQRHSGRFRGTGFLRDLRSFSPTLRFQGADHRVPQPDQADGIK